MCPVYGTISVSFGLNSHQNVMVNTEMQSELIESDIH